MDLLTSTQTSYPKIIIHIGRHKTGTTSLQSFLALNEDLLASKFRVLYPKTGRSLRYSFHHPLFRPMLERLPLDQDKINLIVQEASDRKCQTILLSSEMLSRFNLLDEQLKLIRDAFLKYELHILVYLRSQVPFLESVYAEHIKRGLLAHPKRIQDLEPALDYFKFVDRYSSIFGRKSIIVRSYDKAIECGLYEDFLSAIGISSSDIFQQPKIFLNQRYPWRYLELIRYANRWKYLRRLINNKPLSSFAFRISKIFPNFMNYPKPLSIEECQMITMHYKISNDKLAREFLDRDNLF